MLNFSEVDDYFTERRLKNNIYISVNIYSPRVRLCAQVHASPQVI